MDAFVETESAKTPGTAPAERQCHYLKPDGHTCRAWTIRGQDYCGRHLRFVRFRADRAIDVPLLEDQDAVILFLSETMRALAWGLMPVSNGRILLDGCRLAHTIHSQTIDVAKLRLRGRRAGLSEQELFSAPLTVGIREPDRTAPGVEPEAPRAAKTEPDAAPPAPAAETAEPLTPVMEPPNPRHHHFRDLKNDWDKELLKGESEMTDMFARRFGESEEDFKAARLTPFGHVEEADREVEKAYAHGRRLAEEAAAKAQQEATEAKAQQEAEARAQQEATEAKQPPQTEAQEASREDFARNPIPTELLREPAAAVSAACISVG